MITIPKPCHENWNEMTPKEKGRLCDKCCKVVVDFTEKTTKQIVDFLTANANQKVCGRFRGDQVAIPAPVSMQSRLPRRRVFLAALYFVFGGLLFTSCGSDREEVMGKVAANNRQEFVIGDTVEPGVDTPLHIDHPQPKDPKPQHFMGKVSTISTDTTKKTCKHPKPEPENPPYMMGDVSITVPADTTSTPK